MIFLLEAPSEVEGPVVVVVVAPTAPDDGAKASAAAFGCAWEAPLSATQKLSLIKINRNTSEIYKIP